MVAGLERYLSVLLRCGCPVVLHVECGLTQGTQHSTARDPSDRGGRWSGSCPAQSCSLRGVKPLEAWLKGSPCPTVCGALSDAEDENNTCTHLPSDGERRLWQQGRAQHLGPGSSAWAGRVPSPRTSATLLGPRARHQHPYTPSQGAGHTQASPLWQSLRGRRTKAVPGSQLGASPCTALQHQSPLPDPVTFVRFPWGTLHIYLPSAAWSRPSNAGNHLGPAANTA